MGKQTQFLVGKCHQVGASLSPLSPRRRHQVLMYHFYKHIYIFVVVKEVFRLHFLLPQNIAMLSVSMRLKKR